MSSVSTSCPYCNSHVLVPSPLPANRRLSCPRCGESFAYRGPEPDTAFTERPPPPAIDPAAVPPSPRRWSNRAVAGTVLAVMGTMVALTLTAALATEHIRRAHDLERPERRPPLSMPLILLVGSFIYFAFLIVHLVRVLRRSSAANSVRWQAATGLVLMLLVALALGDLFLIIAKTAALLGMGSLPVAAETELPPVQVVAPLDLESLGYLPAGSNVVIAVHVAQASQTPAGRAFLDRSQLGNSGFGVAEIQEATGLSRDDIDHVVLGLRLDDNLLPAPVLVVRTRKPFDAARLRSALKARRHPELGKKEVYEFELPRLKFNALLWCPTDHFLVVSIARKVMEKLPLTPDTGAERLAPPLRDFLKKRMPAGVQAWAVGHWNDGDTGRVLLSALLPADDRNVLAAVRTFGFWLRLDESIDLNAAIECSDAAGAQTLEKRLQKGRENGADYLKVLGSGDRGDLVSRELARTLQVSQKDRWVTVKATADAKTVGKAVGEP